VHTTKRVLIIGLDGATWTVLTPWLENGSLPNLESLRLAGCWGDLLSTIPPLSAPAWSTFATGKNPGKHSVFHFIRSNDSSDRNQVKPEIVDSRSIASSTFWDILGHHERRVGLINVPMTYPPRPVLGFMITGLLTPPGASVFTYPPELSSKLVDYQIDLDCFISQKPFSRDSEEPPHIEPSLELMHKFQDMMEKRAKTALNLIRSEPWDLFTVVFTGTDRMGHYLWPYHRDVDSDGSPEWCQLHQAVFNYYVRLDQFIGDMIQEVGQDTTVIIMSDHGMGPNYIKSVHWNDWLRRKGLLSAKSTVASPDGWLLRLRLPRDRIARIARIIPGMVESRLIRKVKATRSVKLKSEQTQAYYTHFYNNTGGIHINLSGEEKRRLREDLIQAVRQIIDPDTGQPIVHRVYRGEECFHGPCASDIPDIILVMAPQYGGNSSLSYVSSIVTEVRGTRDPGGHHMEGIFIAKGPEIEPIPQKLSNIAIQDIAPTALQLMRIPIPSDMDGRVLTEILKPATLQNWPVVVGPPVGKWPQDDVSHFVDEHSSSDTEMIQERLRALGYLE
jgi:predicted AlkP superfamily phosphohydrolase/phosphomutase